MTLEVQLQTCIIDIRSSIELLGLKGIGDLAIRMVETRKDKVYPLVYFLLTQALILLFTTVTVERVFFIMNLLKALLHNRIED